MKISQSVHPAGIVISPVNLGKEYGVFDKDGEECLMIDMECAHDVGLVKYDFLILQTVQIIRDTCRYLGRAYPKTYEIDWDDEVVWDDMVRNPTGIFQFGGNYAFTSLKNFKPKSIFDMSLVTAAIRPSGASYRDELFAKKQHKNPSEIIDELLKDNFGYLIYQEDTIKFLQQICGLSGSEADSIRRAIGKKQKDKLEAAMPSILNGYCAKSPQPREVAESEAREFLQVIEDSASYQFGYNHSIAYCLLGYLCAYYRHYYPLEFLTSFLNNATSEDDIKNGTEYARLVGIKVTMPRWRLSKSNYFYNSDENIITKGLSSIKFLSGSVADELYELAVGEEFDDFVDVLIGIDKKTSLNSRQLDILIKIDFFSEFGNQRELLRIADLYCNLFNKGEAKKISKDKIDGTIFEDIVKRFSVGVTKSGGEAKSYTLLDTESILHEAENVIKLQKLEDLGDLLKARNFADSMGYIGYVSGKESDRRKLYVKEIYPLKRKKDGKQFGYSIVTQSIGSGKESRFTVFNRVFEKEPIKKDDIILCNGYTREGIYFTLTSYIHIYS